MKLERTRDMAVVRAIMSDPAIWPHIHEDGTDVCDPVDHDGFHWMLVTDDSGPLGVFLVHARGEVCFEMHTCLLPRSWGVPAARAAQLLAGWAFNETPCRKLVTSVPAYNRRALRFALAGGMRQEGINRASYLRNNELIDQVTLGITKQEWLCQQQSRSQQL
ncbi:MAG: GNAT family N-acetyltransferase [Janthinobacterium lividum]